MQLEDIQNWRYNNKNFTHLEYAHIEQIDNNQNMNRSNPNHLPTRILHKNSSQAFPTNNRSSRNQNTYNLAHRHQNYNQRPQHYAKNQSVMSNTANNRNYKNNSISLDDTDEEQEQLSMPSMGNTNVSENQMEQLSEVIKNLVVKNKLNSKNAFDVPVIDVTCLKAIKNNDDTAWTKISNVLQNSSKVYGYRVDFIADSINKMTNNMQRSQISNQIITAEKAKSKKQQNQISQTRINISQQMSQKIEDDWLQQICDKHLQRQKITQQHPQLKSSNHSSDQNIRRMFDQNGIAGLLLCRLPINKNLNLVVDPTIQFPKKPHHINYQSDLTSIFIESQKYGQNKDFRIIQQIGHFRQFCFVEKQPQQDNKIQVMYDGYNLIFDDAPQMFLASQQQPNLANDSFIHQTMRDQNQFGLEKQKDTLTQINLNQLTKVSIQIDIFGTDINNHYSTKNQIKNEHKIKKQERQNKIKKQRKKRIKNQQIKVDFSINNDLTLQRTEILNSLQLNNNLSNKKEKTNKIRDKNIKKILISQFQMQIQKQTSYLPAILNEEARTHVQDQQRQQNKKNEEDGYAFNGPYSYNIYSDNTTQVNFNNENINHNKVPNIKITKQRLWEIANQAIELQFSQLHSFYQRQYGSISQAILFLSLLHLCNEKGLEIKQQKQYELVIKNPNYRQG